MVKRDYRYVDQHLDFLLESIYPEPISPHHQVSTKAVIQEFVAPRIEKIRNVLDVGCGEGVAAPYFQELGIEWTGVTLGLDFIRCKEKGLNAIEADFNFLVDLPDHSFSLVYSRHSLEHSPMPAISLLEFRRLAREFIIVVVPAPEWGSKYENHYCVMPECGWRNLFRNTGLQILKATEGFCGGSNEPEYRYLLKGVS